MNERESYERHTAARLAAGLPETITDPVALMVAMTVTHNHLLDRLEPMPAGLVAEI